MYLENEKDKTVLGERLEAARKKKKISIKDLAEKTHTGRQTYYDAIHGKYIRPYTVELYAKELGVDIEYLRGETDFETIEKAVEPLQQYNTIGKIKDTISFVSRYGIRIVLDNDKNPSKFSVYDADDNLLEDNADIIKLLPLVKMIHNLFSTGYDLVSLFFDGAYICEE